MDVFLTLMGVLSRGIPGIFVAGIVLVLMLLGLVRKESGLMVVAGFLIIPFAVTFGGWAGFPIVVRLLPLLVFASALAISKDEPLFAWILPAVPFFYLIYAIFRLILSDARGL
jgi:hypothetical protein